MAYRRPAGRVLLVAAVVTLLAAAGTWLAVAWPRPSHTSQPVAPTALTCPEQFRMDATGRSVTPPAPTVPDPGARIVPTATPTHVVVCSYVVGAAGGATAAPTGLAYPLTGHSVLTGSLSSVADALTDLPRATPRGAQCSTGRFETDDDNYLVGLSYPAGVVWVSAPGDHCSGSSNGVFRTSVNLRADVSAWLAAGRWVPPPDPYANDPWTAHCHPVDGRLGQETVMVPGTPTSLTVCVEAGVVALPHTVPSNRIPDVVAAVDALAAAPLGEGTIVCGGEPSYALYFGYPSGPSVDVEVSPATGCTPDVSNGALQAQANPQLLALLQQLTR